MMVDPNRLEPFGRQSGSSSWVWEPFFSWLFGNRSFCSTFCLRRCIKVVNIEQTVSAYIVWCWRYAHLLFRGVINWWSLPAPISYHSAIGRYPRWSRILLQCYSINNEHCVTMWFHWFWLVFFFLSWFVDLFSLQYLQIQSENSRT
jgi:hypothetical protein